MNKLLKHAFWWGLPALMAAYSIPLTAPHFHPKRTIATEVVEKEADSAEALKKDLLKLNEHIEKIEKDNSKNDKKSEEKLSQTDDLYLQYEDLHQRFEKLEKLKESEKTILKAELKKLQEKIDQLAILINSDEVDKKILSDHKEEKEKKKEVVHHKGEDLAQENCRQNSAILDSLSSIQKLLDQQATVLSYLFDQMKNFVALQSKVNDVSNQLNGGYYQYMPPQNLQSSQVGPNLLSYTDTMGSNYNLNSNRAGTSLINDYVYGVSQTQVQQPQQVMPNENGGFLFNFNSNVPSYGGPSSTFGQEASASNSFNAVPSPYSSPEMNFQQQQQQQQVLSGFAPMGFSI